MRSYFLQRSISSINEPSLLTFYFEKSKLSFISNNRSKIEINNFDALDKNNLKEKICVDEFHELIELRKK